MNQKKKKIVPRVALIVHVDAGATGWHIHLLLSGHLSHRNLAITITLLLEYTYLYSFQSRYMTYHDLLQPSLLFLVTTPAPPRSTSNLLVRVGSANSITHLRNF